MKNEKGRSSTTVKFNTKRFSEICKKTGKSNITISKELGYTSGFVTNSIKAGSMRDASLKLFCLMYGDFGADYNKLIELDDQPEEEIEEKETETNIESRRDLSAVLEEMVNEIKAIRTELEDFKNCFGNSVFALQRSNPETYNEVEQIEDEDMSFLD